MSLAFDTSVAGVASLVSVLLFLYTLTVILRFVARKRQDAPLLVDDWLVIPGLICFVGLVIIAIYGMAHGFIGYSTPEDPAIVAAFNPIEKRVYWVVAQLSVIGLGCIRLSAVFFYRRIFCSDRKSVFNYLSWFIIGMVGAWTIAYFILTWLQCGPDPNYWEKLFVGSTQCVTYPYLISMAITSFCLDVFIIFLPLPMIWSLHATKTRKATISAVFLLAAAGVAASCARMVIYIQLWKAGLAHNKIDGFVANTHAYYYQTLEEGLCGIAINLPSLWYFVVGIRPGSVLRSVKSLVSLRSLGSKHSTQMEAEKERRMGDKESTSYERSTVSDHSLEPNTATAGVPSRRDDMEHTAPLPVHAVSRYSRD